LKTDYENKLNEEAKTGKRIGKESDSILEVYEYNILKTYFIIPFFPVFKPSILRKDFNFALYLTYCLTGKLKLFFKWSWTCWVSTIMLFLFWNIFLSRANITFLAYYMMLIPLLAIFMLFIMNFYMKHVYRGVISEVNKLNYLDVIDIAPFDLGNTRSNIITYPLYLENALKEMNNENADNIIVSNYNFHKFFHGRPPSLYEDLVILGATGFYLIINTIQIIGFCFITWIVIMIIRYYSMFITQIGNNFSFIFIPLLFLYTIFFAFMIAINIRWYTIISSIEMRRNDKNVKKVINKQIENAAETVEIIYQGFKRLFYDMKLNEKKKKGDKDAKVLPLDNKLGVSEITLMNLINVQIRRFKLIPKNDIHNIHKYKISVKDDLKSFFKTTGNRLSDNEIQHVLHFIESFSEKDLDSLTNEHIYEMYCSTLYFSNEFPQQIINEVFKQYFDEREEIETVTNFSDKKGLNLSKISDFLHWYSNYFGHELITFIKEECAYLEKDFSIDAFIHMLISLRRYNPY